MLDCTFVLSARWADNFEIVASGEALGADEREVVAVMLDRHHEDICSVGGVVDGDIFWGIEQWADADDIQFHWRESHLGRVLTTTIPCRTACPDEPDVEAPPVLLTVLFVPWEPDASREPPTTVIGAFLRQFQRQPKRLWHPSLGCRREAPLREPGALSSLR